MVMTMDKQKILEKAELFGKRAEVEDSDGEVVDWWMEFTLDELCKYRQSIEQSVIERLNARTPIGYMLWNRVEALKTTNVCTTITTHRAFKNDVALFTTATLEE